MIERLHRQLKAAITCRPNSAWLEALPAVALGLRATFKSDIQATPVELVYGEPLRLPGELLSAPTSDITSSDPTDFAARLRRTMASLRPSPAARHTKPTPFVFKDLATCSRAFLRDDTVRAPFQPPYSGPYKVIRRDNRTFTLQISGRDVRVSIDRLKPSYILSVRMYDGFSRSPTTASNASARALHHALWTARAHPQCSMASVGHPQQLPTPRPVPYITRFGRHVRIPNALQT
ncbi:uncharacterized protein LOC119383579 [Rhipicephalus sanguineus]|uniref:uncharacterized protein LOC119383579 n=1 Tax=Rhipicephalus sanguineus TaxID=34632 RepID=UPI001892F5DF|nr:uncharacterized protein LOC119383579 [Rhipicephalus sanguineus]